MAKCDYEKEYPDIATGKEIHFKCDEGAHRNGKCRFHLENYLTDTTADEVRRLFLKKFSDAKSNNGSSGDEKLSCVGYILPSLSLPDKEPIATAIDFTYAEFRGKVDLSDIVFEKEISFYGSIFRKSVSFTSSKFVKSAIFSSAKFHSSSDFNSFYHAKFKGLAYFGGATLANMKFTKAEFGNAVFAESKFLEEAIFCGVNFSGNINFENAEFSGDADFSESKFCGVVKFENTRFGSRADFSKVSFCKETTFNTNMSNVSFLDSDIKGIKFGNWVSWNRGKNSGTGGKNDRLLQRVKNADFKIYDERSLEKDDSKNPINLESIKNVYRDLRDNFDQNLQYDTAGEFFVREMELNRKYHGRTKNRRHTPIKKSFLSRSVFSFYWWYNILAQYGQSCYRPTYFAIAIISVGTLVLLCESMGEGAHTGKHAFDYDLLLTAFTRCISAFIPFFTFPLTPTPIDYVLRLLLLPISVTFFIALKRKMERKLRH